MLACACLYIYYILKLYAVPFTYSYLGLMTLIDSGGYVDGAYAAYLR